jgi:elongin-A
MFAYTFFVYQHALELASPQFAEHDKELWIEFIKRDIPNWDQYELPEESNDWYQVYCDLGEQVERSLEADAEKMKMALDGISNQRARLTPKILDNGKSLRMAGARPTTKQRYASWDRKMGGVEPVHEPSGWALNLPRLPREGFPKKKGIFAPQKRNNALSVPSNKLNNRASQVTRAPQSLVEEHRRPEPAPVSKMKSNPAMIGSRQPSAATLKHPLLPARGVREDRLRALTSGKSLPSPAAKKLPVPEPNLKRPASPPPVSKAPAISHDSPSSSHPPSSGPPAPRPAVIRRRQEPSIFMPAKRKRVT